MSMNAQFNRQIEQICTLGPRVVAEMLAELGRRTLHMTTIEQTVERYAQLDPKAVRAVGADQFPSRPKLRVVGGRRHG
jgi:hypothetical protein